MQMAHMRRMSSRGGWVFEVESCPWGNAMRGRIETHNVPRYKCDVLAHLPQHGLKLSCPRRRDSTIDVPAHHVGGPRRLRARTLSPLNFRPEREVRRAQVARYREPRGCVRNGGVRESSLVLKNGGALWFST